MTEPDKANDPNAADLLYGVKAIAAFLGLTERQAQHRIDDGEIPTFRMGGKKRGTICARRSSLRTWLGFLERQAQASNDNSNAEGDA